MITCLLPAESAAKFGATATMPRNEKFRGIAVCGGDRTVVLAAIPEPPTLPTTPDGLITLAQAALLTGRSEKTCWTWTDRGYEALNGSRVIVPVKRRDKGWTILVDPVDIAKAVYAIDERARRLREERTRRLLALAGAA